MTESKKTKWSVLVFAASLAVAAPLFAQNGPPGGGGPGGGGPGGDPNGGPGGGGPGGPPSAAEHRQRDLEHIQDEMDLPADRWQALQTKLEKLMVMEDDVHPHGPPRPEDEEQNASPLRKALGELRDALDDKDAKADDIKAKVDAYEKAKAREMDEIKKAEDDLRANLTQVQQAILILHGVLD